MDVNIENIIEKQVAQEISDMDIEDIIKGEIRRSITVRVQDLVKQDYNRVIEKIVDGIYGTKIVKKE